MKVTLKEFKNSFVSVRDNFYLHIPTQKIYAAVLLDDTQEVLLLEPLIFEEKIEKMEEKVTKRLGELLGSFV